MKKALGMLVLSGALSVGCSAEMADELQAGEGEGEAVASVEQPFTEFTCPGLTPDTFLSVSGINSAQTSVYSSYGHEHCTEALKVHVQALNAPKLGAYAFWGGPTPTTQAACTSIRLTARLWEKVNGTWTVKFHQQSTPVWSTVGARPTCVNLHSYVGPHTVNTRNEMRLLVQAKQNGVLKPVRAFIATHN